MVLVAALSTISQSTSRRTPINAHPLGAPVPIIIEFGEQYLGSELYDAKITVVEVLRGEKAWSLVKQASPSNSPPITGFDYILARVKFEFSARTLPALDRYDLNETQFTATDADGHDWSVPTLGVFPQPRLNATLKPGESLQGWLVFLVPKTVTKPLMVFREDVGEVSHRGGGTWFQLYSRPASSLKPKR
jgi:hypothetical protein